MKSLVTYMQNKLEKFAKIEMQKWEELTEKASITDN